MPPFREPTHRNLARLRKGGVEGELTAAIARACGCAVFMLALTVFLLSYGLLFAGGIWLLHRLISVF